MDFLANPKPQQEETEIKVIQTEWERDKRKHMLEHYMRASQSTQVNVREGNRSRVLRVWNHIFEDFMKKT